MEDQLKKKYNKLLSSSDVALGELDKVINQKISPDELEPEKAKIAVQGKVEAIQGSLTILDRMEEIKNKIKAEEDERNKQDDTEGKKEISAGSGLGDRLRDKTGQQ